MTIAMKDGTEIQGINGKQKYSTKTLLPTKVFAKAWQTEGQSTANRYFTVSGLDKQQFQAFANTRSLCEMLL